MDPEDASPSESLLRGEEESTLEQDFIELTSVDDTFAQPTDIQHETAFHLTDAVRTVVAPKNVENPFADDLYKTSTDNETIAEASSFSVRKSLNTAQMNLPANTTLTSGKYAMYNILYLLCAS